MGALDHFSNYFSDIFVCRTRHKIKRKKELHTVELKVRMDCDGCERKVKRALESLSGISSVDVDRKAQKVTVVGYVEPKKVLRRVKRTGKRTEFWPYVPYNQVAHPYSAHAYDKKAPSGYVRKDSFNHNAANRPPDEKYSDMFSEENPNACSLM